MKGTGLDGTAPVRSLKAGFVVSWCALVARATAPVVCSSVSVSRVALVVVCVIVLAGVGRSAFGGILFCCSIVR